MHHWQLIDDRTLALLAHLSHHFPAYETHRLDLAYPLPLSLFIFLACTAQDKDSSPAHHPHHGG
jgi:hypothetical protein